MKISDLEIRKAIRQVLLERLSGQQEEDSIAFNIPRNKVDTELSVRSEISNSTFRDQLNNNYVFVSESDARFLYDKIDKALPTLYQNWVDYISSGTYLEKFKFAKEDKEGFLKNLPVTPEEFTELILDHSRKLNLENGLDSKNVIIISKSSYNDLIPMRNVAAKRHPFAAAIATSSQSSPPDASFIMGRAQETIVEDKPIDPDKLGQHEVSIEGSEVIFKRSSLYLFMVLSLENKLSSYIFFGGKTKLTEKRYLQLDQSAFDERLFLRLVENSVFHELQHIENAFALDASYSETKEGPYAKYLETILDFDSPYMKNYVKNPVELRVRLNKLVQFAQSPTESFKKYIEKAYDVQKQRDTADDTESVDTDIEAWGGIDWDDDLEEEFHETGYDLESKEILPAGHKGRIKSNDTSSVEACLERLLEIGYIRWSLLRSSVRQETIRAFTRAFYKTINYDSDIIRMLSLIDYEKSGNDFSEMSKKLPKIARELPAIEETLPYEDSPGIKT